MSAESQLHTVKRRAGDRRGLASMSGSWKATLRRTLLPGMHRFLRAVRRGRALVVQRTPAALGLNVSRMADYYSPLPSLSDLKAHQARWCRPSAMRGIAYDTSRMKGALAALISKYGGELKQLPDYRTISRLGPGYTETDGWCCT